ncbi:MAG TPA: hypothetical protein VE569_10990, partial [Acidimicrobiia bacterium]|nr:hypothetical protein [Acidimicrobiia bacterium]
MGDARCRLIAVDGGGDGVCDGHIYQRTRLGERTEGTKDPNRDGPMTLDSERSTVVLEIGRAPALI